MRKILLVLLVLLMTSCGAPATQMPAPATEPRAATEAPIATESVIEPYTASSPEFIAPTSTALPTSTPLPPTAGSTQTETALPTLELPTELANPPARVAWDGEPTYPGDSQPGYDFRLFYDPELWAVTTDNFGSPALAHRSIMDCIIVPSVGHGLPSNITVDHEVRKIGPVEYEISTAYLNGVPQFVTYLGGDFNVYTGFELSFKEQTDLCIKEAETVLSTLISIPVSQATPGP